MLCCIYFDKTDPPMIWFIFLLYLSIAALGVACCWISFQVAARDRFTLIRVGRAEPLQHPELVAKGFATMVGTVGVAVLVFLVAIPFIGIPWNTWHFYLMLIGGLAGIWKSLLLRRHDKLLATSALSVKNG
jgi:hypothetical protein